MSLFISLSSTSKIFGMLVSPAFGYLGFCRLKTRRTLSRIGKGGLISVRDCGRSSISVLFYQDSKTVSLDWLDQVIRGAQIHATGLVIHDGHHNHRNFGEFLIALQPVQHCPSVTFGHDYIERNKEWANFLSEAESLFSVRGDDYAEIQFR